MKRFHVLLIVIVLVFSVTHEIGGPTTSHFYETDLSPNQAFSYSSVTDSGDNRDADLFFERSITGQQVDLLNTYSNTSDHSSNIDLSSYQIDGWTLYNAQIDIVSIDAAVEKEVVGVTYENFNFQITEILGTFYSKLAQGFYNQPHDGALVDYSLYYSTSQYNTSLRGNASSVVYSDYQTSSAITTPINMTESDGTFTWSTFSGGNASLSANTVYWTIINGSLLQKVGDPIPSYPIIYWGAENAAGDFGSYQRGVSAWDLKTLEALMRYTYIPWNQTADSSMVYTSPLQVDLKANNSAISAQSFSITSANANITLIEMKSNQSIFLDYDITLSYRKNTVATSIWKADTSGGTIEWNTTITLDFPEVSGNLARYLNLSKSASWTITGLYNSTTPQTSYEHYIVSGTIVQCSEMADETWSLLATSYNHLTDLDLFDSSDDTEIVTKSMIDVDIAINSTLTEQDLDPISTGTTNLTIQHQGATIWTPVNQSVTAGETYYLWDVSAASTHGLYIIEQFWSNGTDAGYRTREITLYYPSTLIAAQSQIDGFTESTIDISVDFDDTYTPQGLDGAFASVLYSFDGGVNTSLVDQSGGTWTASISTTGKSPGTYSVVVYAEGYGLENKSTTIDVTLIHDTQSLTVLWSNTNDISYVESTELSVAYNRVGSSPISGATVNVTIGTTTWDLTWDSGSDTYKRIFYGDDVDPGFGTHNLIIEAWRDGYKSQSNSSETLDIHEEISTINVEWSGSNSITYVESIVLYVDYEMSNTTAIPGATVEVTIDSNTWLMNWNDTSKRYWYQFNGVDALPGLGVHSLTIEADKSGYKFRNDLLQTLTITEEPTTLVLSWSNGNSISYVQTTTLVVNYTQSSGAPVSGATVNVSIGAGFWTMTWNPATFVYELTITGSDVIPGFGTHSVTVLADNTGFVDQSDATQNLIVTLESTTMLVSWSNTNNITFIEQTTLIISFRMSNTTAIPDATVNVTIGGTRWDLAWDGGTETYQVLFLGSDIPPGFGTHSLIIRAGNYGYENQVDSTENLILNEEQTSLLISWSDSATITYIESTTLIVTYRMSDTTPISSATVTVTIGSDSWPLIWHAGTQTYQYSFSGSANPPGFGIHSLTIDANRTGFVTQSDATEIMTVSEEPTTIGIAWSNTNSITFIESTTLSVNYTMSNGSPVTGAIVNVTIGGTRWDLIWDGGSETYQVLFLGSDSPPGFGIHSLTIRAGKYGHVNQVDSAESFTMSEEPTSLVISWLNTNSITYIESTTLIVSYRMSNTTPITTATITVTIGSDSWPLVWHPGTQTYQYTFTGADSPPGFGVHSLTIDANKTGYESQVDGTEILTLIKEPTTMVITWSNTNSITFVESTILIVNYTMNDGSPVTGAAVNATIGGTRWDLVWEAGSETYQVEFFGSDIPPGFGTQSLTIRAGKFGFVNQVNSTENLTLSEEPTSLVITWSNTDTITYIESTILFASYRMSDNTPISSATLTMTIGADVLPLVWHAGTQTYQYAFTGAGAFPSFGIHSLTIEANKTGYETQVDASEVLTINEVPTTIVISWSNTNTITFIESTILSVNFTQSDGSPVTGVLVNATVGGRLWILTWDIGSETYQVEFFGSDEPPGFGTYGVTIMADRYGYESHTDVSQSLTLESEPTSLVVNWIPDNDITFATYSILSVSYRMSDATPISGAMVNVTFGGTLWPLVWSLGDQDYRLQINGSDVPPGFGIYSLNIQASKKGFDPQTDLTESVTLREEPTSLVIS